MKYRSRLMLIWVFSLSCAWIHADQFPQRGMYKSAVESTWGKPVKKLHAVGNPPISRWVYPQFIVYFQDNYVIDTVYTSTNAVNSIKNNSSNSTGT